MVRFFSALNISWGPAPWVISATALLASTASAGQAVLYPAPYNLDFDGKRLLGWIGNKPRQVVRQSRTSGNLVRGPESDQWTVCLWNIQDGGLIGALNGPREAWAASFLPDGSVAASSWLSPGELNLVAFEMVLRLWNPEGGRRFRSLKDRVLAGFAPDGKTLATYVKLKREPPRWAIALQDMKSGRRRWQYSSRLSGPSLMPLEFSPDGKLLLVERGAGTGSVLLDASTGQPCSGKVSSILASWESPSWNSVHFMNNQFVAGFMGGQVGGAAERIGVLSLANGSLVHAISFDRYFYRWAWSTPAQLLFTIDESVARSTDVWSGKSVEAPLPNVGDASNWLQMVAAPDGGRFIALCEFGSVKAGLPGYRVVLFDGATCKEISRSPENQLIGFSPDGKIYLTRSDLVYVHDSETGKVLRSFRLQSPQEKHVLLLPGGG